MNNVVQQFFLIEKNFRDNDELNIYIFYIKIVKNLITIIFQNDFLQRAKSSFQFFFNQPIEIIKFQLEYFAIKNELCVIY